MHKWGKINLPWGGAHPHLTGLNLLNHPNKFLHITEIIIESATFMWFIWAIHGSNMATVVIIKRPIMRSIM